MNTGIVLKSVDSLLIFSRVNRGGNANNGSNAGLFNVNRNTGNAWTNNGSRAVVVAGDYGMKVVVLRLVQGLNEKYLS